jgi:hypothetical protein
MKKFDKYRINKFVRLELTERLLNWENKMRIISNFNKKSSELGFGAYFSNRAWTLLSRRVKHLYKRGWRRFSDIQRKYRPVFLPEDLKRGVLEENQAWRGLIVKLWRNRGFFKWYVREKRKLSVQKKGVGVGFGKLLYQYPTFVGLPSPVLKKFQKSLNTFFKVRSNFFFNAVNASTDSYNGLQVLPHASPSNALKIGSLIYKVADLRPILAKYSYSTRSLNFYFLPYLVLLFLVGFCAFSIAILALLLLFIFFWLALAAGTNINLLLRFSSLMEVGLYPLDQLIPAVELLLIFNCLVEFLGNFGMSILFLGLDLNYDSAIDYYNNYLPYVLPFVNFWYVGWEGVLDTTDMLMDVKFFLLSLTSSYLIWIMLLLAFAGFVAFFYLWFEYRLRYSDNWKLLLNLLYAEDSLRFFAKSQPLLQNLEGFEKDYLLVNPLRFLKSAPLNTVDTYYEYLFCQSVGGYVGFFDLFPSYAVAFNGRWQKFKKLWIHWYQTPNHYEGPIFREHVLRAWGTWLFQEYGYSFLAATKKLRNTHLVGTLQSTFGRSLDQNKIQKSSEWLSLTSPFTVKFYLEVYNSVYFWILNTFSTISRLGEWWRFWERYKTLEFASRGLLQNEEERILLEKEVPQEKKRFERVLREAAKEGAGFQKAQITHSYVHEYYRELNQLVVRRTFTRVFGRRPLKRFQMRLTWPLFVGDYAFWKRTFNYNDSFEYSGSKRSFFEFNGEFPDIFYDAEHHKIEKEEGLLERLAWEKGFGSDGSRDFIPIEYPGDGGEEEEPDEFYVNMPDNDDDPEFEDAHLQGFSDAGPPTWDKALEDYDEYDDDIMTTRDELIRRNLLTEEFFLDPELVVEKFKNEEEWEEIREDEDLFLFFRRIEDFLTEDVFYDGVGQTLGADVLTNTSDYSGTWALEFGDSFHYKERLFSTVYDDLADFYWLNSDGFFYTNFFDYPADRFLVDWPINKIESVRRAERRVLRLGRFVSFFRPYLGNLVRSTYLEMTRLIDAILVPYTFFFAFCFLLLSALLAGHPEVSILLFLNLFITFSVLFASLLLFLAVLFVFGYKFFDGLAFLFSKWYLGRTHGIGVYFLLIACVSFFLDFFAQNLKYSFSPEQERKLQRSLLCTKIQGDFQYSSSSYFVERGLTLLRSSTFRPFLPDFLFSGVFSRSFFLNLQSFVAFRYWIYNNSLGNFSEFLQTLPATFFAPQNMVRTLTQNPTLNFSSKSGFINFFDLHIFPVNLAGRGVGTLSLGSLTRSSRTHINFIANSSEFLMPRHQLFLSMRPSFGISVLYDFNLIESASSDLLRVLSTSSNIDFSNIFDGGLVYENVFGDSARLHRKSSFFASSKTLVSHTVNTFNSSLTPSQAELSIAGSLGDQRDAFFFNSLEWPHLWWGKKKRRIVGLGSGFAFDVVNDKEWGLPSTLGINAQTKLDHDGRARKIWPSKTYSRGWGWPDQAFLSDGMFLTRARSTSYSSFLEVLFSKETMSSVYEKRAKPVNFAFNEALFYSSFFGANEGPILSNRLDSVGQIYGSFYKRI